MTLRTHPVTPSGRNPAGRHNPHIRPTHHVRPRHTPPTTSANGPAAPRRNRLSSGRERHPSNRTRVARGRPPHEVTPGEATTHEEAMSLARAPACTRGPDPGRDRAAQGGGPREGAGPTTRERPHDGERPQEVERLHGGERPREVAGPTMNALRAGWSPRGAGRHQGAGRTKAQPAATAARTTAQPVPDRRASAARTRPQHARPPDHSPPDNPARTRPQVTQGHRSHKGSPAPRRRSQRVGRQPRGRPAGSTIYARSTPGRRAGATLAEGVCAFGHGTGNELDVTPTPGKPGPGSQSKDHSTYLHGGSAAEGEAVR